ncbi:MAG: acetyl-CoA carboxylase carboxyltransferase subunit alpha [Chlamydiota bacterium]|nr:acetyl-CoA carboxylase carboxyltransferase subunit alpha [Chlamydiota bacterium]
MMLKREKEMLSHEETLRCLRQQHDEGGPWKGEDIDSLEAQLKEMKQALYRSLTPDERVSICRHPKRPRSVDYIHHLCDEFVEIFGDRHYGDDSAIVTGFGEIGCRKVVIIAQEKGGDTESRLYRNFGMPHPEGYRKAMRIMRLAEKFQLPILSLIDTPGAYPGLAAEERGQGRAIAYNLREMSALKTPIMALIIGEGCSGGALGIGLADQIAMLEHAYYSVISPEGCASILWKDAGKSNEAAKQLKMQSEDLLREGVIDTIIQEPQGGAHYDPNTLYSHVKNWIQESLEALEKIPLHDLLDHRYQKFRRIGSHIKQSM